MGKIFILGFNADKPRGGMLDLLTTICADRDIPFGTDLTCQDYAIGSAALAVIVSRFEPFERYQVVHVGQYGSIQMVEHWEKASFLALPSQAERDSDSIFENPKGDYVRRYALQHHCATSVGYSPG